MTTHIRVRGYGIMTSGIIPHLAKMDDTFVTIDSRHLTSAPPNTRLASAGDPPPDVILGCFSSDEEARDWWTSPSTTKLLPGTSCIDISTISPHWAEQWHQHCATHGATSSELPVTGSRPGALSGALSGFLYRAGEDPRADKAISSFTQRIYRFSRPGNPTRFKLLYNTWGASILHTLAVYAQRMQHALEEDMAVASQVITSDGWMAPVASSKLHRATTRNYTDPDFSVAHMAKDVSYTISAFGNDPLSTLALGALHKAMATHGPHVDYTAATDPEINQ